ncbi:MAG: class I SAM-dependent methyltransferase [Bacteroidia bacterium]
MEQTILLNKNLKALLEEIVVLNKMQKSFIQSSLEALTPEEIENLNIYIDFLVTKESLEISYIAKCYDLIVKDTLREQIYFLRHKHYRYSTYEEVAGSVYLNDDYMTKYMYGLAITSFLWPQHCQMKRWFSDRIPKNRKGKYLEIGPGHGYYFMDAQKKTSFENFIGVDISPTSIRLTKSILESGFFGKFSNYELKLIDFLAVDLNEKYDAVVMGEVLEHVESPVAFIKKINKSSKQDAFIYVTTVINAPAIDHIALFTNVEDLDKCVNDGGLKLKEYFLTASNNKLSVEENLKKLLPVNIAMVLEH